MSRKAREPKKRDMNSTEIYTLTRLSFRNALDKVPLAFQDAYRWFEDNENAVLGSLPSGDLRPDGLEIPITHPQRGIHKPKRVPGYEDYVLSIKISKNGIYTDRIFEQDDGTWVLWYCEQQKGSASGATSKGAYNRGLLNCLRDGVPVGVFIRAADNGIAFICKGLAFVEEYDPQRGLFKLHGPVRSDQSDDFWSLYEVGEVEGKLSEDNLSPVDLDERRSELIYQVIRQRQDAFRTDLLTAYDGLCAVTAYDVPETLQAAHISSYRGPRSQKTSNGLLLRADIHLLYDAHLASVDPETMKFIVAPKIERSAYGDLNGQIIRLPYYDSDKPSEPRLATHFAEFRMKHTI